LARGYYHRPDLTAERFVPNPFQPRERLYRTGDLARWRRDGTLEFLGRIDHQIKIRGFRIELGEIEAVLKKHPHVRELAVLAREDQTGDKRLVAYAVAQPGKALTEEELRQTARNRLPEYMVPPAFVFLENMPLTPNGKIDRKALPTPEASNREQPKDFVAPRTATETQIAAIWAEVLGLKEVGVRDDFFGLGGHSLKAV
jgi:acyl-coenzyme A synthetase/AMP-(fatty) acid ligase